MTISNTDSESHTVQVLIERGEEIVHWTTHEVPAGDPSQEPNHAEIRSYDWSQFKTKAGQYIVSATDDGGNWDRQDLTKIEAHSKCVEIEVRIEPTGDVEVVVLL